MPEQEKVVKTIEGLKELRSHFRAMAGIASSNQARAGHIESARIIDGAITILEMQEPVEPTIGGDADGQYGAWWHQCGKCKAEIDYLDKYCRCCGQAVKWE